MVLLVCQQMKNKLDQWNLNNAKVIAWMLNSVHVDIAMGLRPFSLASEMWLHLRNVYQQRNLAREFEVKHNIVEYTQGDKMFLPFMPACSCSGLKEVLEERQRTRMVQFLMKLRYEFEFIRGSLLNRKVTLALDVVLAAILREETRLGTQAAIESMTLLVVALLAQKSTIGTLSGNTKRIVQCYECNDFGHIAANYPKKKFFCAYYKITGHHILDYRRCPNHSRLAH
ncbi:hypothetical protein H5410_035396 [Solanum commersonii]|uniref:Uncharacterized protein n=1 Tax=Solanum commersonii TaxID=4109 RepID=A0A9J5Y4J5_SOLCO|nr:hypothetical protein H5410_035396 [Solanum commersonii]